MIIKNHQRLWFFPSELMKFFIQINYIISLFVLLSTQIFAQSDEIGGQFTNETTGEELPLIFCDNMVLQRDTPIPIWGRTRPGQQVVITFRDQEYIVVANDTGTWSAKLNAHPAGGPYTMSIIGRDTVVFHNILVGEVWLASGQSNMEMPMVSDWATVDNFQWEVTHAEYPNIRLLQIDKHSSPKPSWKIITKGWQLCDSTSVKEFSSAAYFFARYLYKQLNVPIGIINSSWGGTLIEAWMSQSAIKKFHVLSNKIQKIEDAGANPYPISSISNAKQNYYKARELYAYNNLSNDDDKNDATQFLESQLKKLSNWRKMELPSIWEERGLHIDGVVWFKKTIQIPATWLEKDLILSLSPIDDLDMTWFNGTLIGKNEIWNQPRSYTIPADLVKEGKNEIVIQVIDLGSGGGIWGDSTLLNLSHPEQGYFPLYGAWEYAIETEFESPWTSTVLYNGMIAPLIPFAMRGVIWYQGESNTDNAFQYRQFFPALIQDWRSKWGLGNFPFLFVQLASFMQKQPQPSEDSWAELREAQLMTLSVTNTGMAVTIDIGDSNDIHPGNKQEVGRRLGLVARKIAYGEDIIYSGPIFKEMKRDKNKIRLYFEHTDGGLRTEGESELKGFAIAGEDHKFFWADAKIEHNTVVVWSTDVAEPIAVRYGWAANPECNLYNGHGLPTSPFRTDSWPALTQMK